MEILAIDAVISPDLTHVPFIIVVARQPVQCSITKEALEELFWAPAAADERRLMKVFADGKNRIIAAAELKSRARQSENVASGSSDFRIAALR